MKTKTMVLKVQRSACGTQCLIYSEDRTTVDTQRPWKQVKHLPVLCDMLPLAKVYVRADCTDKIIVIRCRVPGEDW